jgi:hypothetical protein
MERVKSNKKLMTEQTKLPKNISNGLKFCYSLLFLYLK